MHRSSSLPARKTVIVSALGILALVWIFVLVQVRYERQEAVGAAVRQNVNLAMAFEQYVTRTLEGANLAGAHVADRYADLLKPGRPARTDVAVIDDQALRSASLREINLFTAQGQLVATSVRPVPRTVNIADTSIFRFHRSSAAMGLRVNPPSRSRFLKGSFIVLSRRINDRDGRFAGVVGVQVRPSELTNFLHGATLSETDAVSVIGLDGLTRARRTGNAESFGEDLRDTLVMKMQEQDPYGTYLGASSLDGVVRYFSHRRLPRYDLFVTSGVAEAAILRPVQARARGYIAGASLITAATLLAAVLVLALIERRLRREAEIIAANARLREAQQLARLGEWRFDIGSQTFLWCEGLCAMYERPHSTEGVTLREFGEIVGQHGLETFRSVLEQMQASGERQEYELAARLPGGAISHRRIVAVPDLDTAGRLVGVHGTDQDVTPRRLLESLQQQVGHLSRIDALNAVAATLAHELNQPLAAASNYLSGSIRMLSPASVDRAALAEALDDVRTQILRAGEIIRRVRAMVSNRQAHVEATTLADAIEGAVVLADAANPGIAGIVSRDEEGGCARVMADTIQLQQVLVNLIRNAWEASRAGEPRVTLKTRCLDPTTIEVCVIDNGQGIVGEERNIFSPFTTTNGEGLGIGLAISRTLIEAMGGRIWVAETGNQGTTICFTLPAAHDAP